MPCSSCFRKETELYLIMTESSTIKIQCPNCGRKLDVTDMQPLTTQNCPDCGAPFFVPKWFLKSILLEEMLFEDEDLTIYRALEPALDRESCVKIYRNMESADDLLAAVRRQSQLIHPGIAAIYSCGDSEEGTYVNSQFGRHHPFFGEQLATSAEICDTACQLCKALKAADDAGMAHGGICPVTVLDSSDGKLLLTDFGVAVALNKPATPYTAPERRGDCLATRAGDIYSVGALLYQLATGTVPGMDGEPVQPANSLNPEVSVALSTLLAEMLEEDPARRPDGYSGLVDRFEKIAVAPKLKVFRDTRPRAPLENKRKGNGGVLNILIVLALLVLAGLAVFYFKGPQIMKFLKGGHPRVSNMEELTLEDDEAEEENRELDVFERKTAEEAQKSGEKPAPEVNKVKRPVYPEECLKARPRPKDLDFVAVKEATRKYMQLVPDDLQQIEKERIRIIGSTLDDLAMSMKSGSYNRGEDNVIHLRNGKTLRGSIPFPPRNGKIRIRPDKGDTIEVKFSDLTMNQILDILQFYAEKRVEMAEGRRVTTAMKSDFYYAYLQLALVCDWYEKPDLARKFAKKAYRYRPDRRGELKSFGLRFGKKKE